ncbi:hypothetical protein Syun_026055 [Stephania yunnanensis]|uniref:Uncharacterized protein n=1 Tax=Stephania yunnanensis TaxID=152371 RepID=A0AAP0ESU3_9MAGN
MGILSMVLEHTSKMKTQLNRMESRMARIEVEVKRISTIEALIEEVRSEVKTVIRGMARKCDELFLQHMGFTSTILREQKIGAYSSAEVSDPSNIGLFEELMTPGVPQSPDLIVKHIPEQSRSEILTPNALLIISIVQDFASGPSLHSFTKVNASFTVYEFIFNASRPPASTPMRQPLRTPDLSLVSNFILRNRPSTMATRSR